MQIEIHRDSEGRNFNEEQGGSQWHLLPETGLTVSEEQFKPADMITAGNPRNLHGKTQQWREAVDGKDYTSW